MVSRNWLLLIVVLMVALLPRMFDLDAFLGPDEPRWQENTLGFREGLRTGNMRQLYQQPHPGIPTMWLAAPVVEAPSWGVRRLPHAVTIAALIALAAYLLARRWGWAVGFWGGLLLALNPHFIAHSRVLAMDALLSIFLLISVLALLVWLGERKWYWLALSGAAGALAVLSKMIGVVILPVILIVLLWDWLRLHLKKVSLPQGAKSSAQVLRTACAAWFTAAAVATLIVFPTIITDFDKVAAGTKEFFATEHYSQQVHALGPWWYPQAFLLWTTPLQLLGLATLPFVFWRDKSNRKSLIILIVFALLFFLTIQYSIKKGDRYALPEFLFFDVLVALTLVGAWRFFPQKAVRGVVAVVLAVALGWQVWNLFELHPHYLAYRNPFFRNVAEGRTMGWGEGLDLAAEYLNQKPQAEQLLVLAYYEGQFGYRFKGEVTGVERLAKETLQEVGANYVVLYRTMQGRAPDRWETKVLAQFTEEIPEHVISLNGEEYVWIYKVK